MRRHGLVSKLIALALLATPAAAQEPREFTPPDRELWQQMKTAFGNVAMPLAAHQQVLAIMENVEREAQMRDMRAKAKTEGQSTR